jgi:hypothetical protein
VRSTERAKLRDIQDQPIESYGKKIVDVKFMGDGGQRDISCSLSMDVSHVGKDIVSMGRLLRAGFDMHFTDKGHTCWMEHQGVSSRIEEDDPSSEAPLFYLSMEAQPIPEDGGRPRDEADFLVAPVSMEEEIPVGREVDVAGLTTNVEWNSVRGKCLGKALTEGRWLISTADGHPLNVRAENVRRLEMPVAEVPQPVAPMRVPTAVALRSPDDAPSRAVIESHNLAHIPYAGWCEICVNAKGRSDHHVLAEPRPIPLVQMDYQYMSATGDLCNFQAAKATVLTVVDTDQGEVAVNQVAKKGDDQFAIRFVSIMELRNLEMPWLRVLHEEQECMKMNLRPPGHGSLTSSRASSKSPSSAVSRASRRRGRRTFSTYCRASP